MHALVMLLMTGAALFLFSREKIHLESSSLAILVMLVVGFQLFPFEGARGTVEPMAFFYGFGHEALIVRFSMFDFVLPVAMAASVAIIYLWLVAPHMIPKRMAYKTNLLVMNAGGYKFNDFVRVGTPLTLLMWVVLSAVLTYAYQL
ncbi:MAG: hypothetical protein QNK22_09405 [Xanthomonadales bacterium]|nr:hypothetical protein [Xanthomonadales bacterium]